MIMGTMEKIYMRYDYLATHYANKIWNTSDSALEKKDLVQELRIRLFTSIQTYVRQWSEHKAGKGRKPVPMDFYVKTVMINKSRDLINQINSNLSISIEDSGFQIGTSALPISASGCTVTIGAQNLLDLFHDDEQALMRLYFAMDFDLERVKKVYKGKCPVNLVIKDGLKKIRAFLEDENEDIQEFSYFESQE